MTDLEKQKFMAYHEAAHTVMCILEGKKFDSVFFFLDDSTNPLAKERIVIEIGVARHTGRFSLDPEEVVHKDHALAEARIAIAGIVAMKLMAPSQSYFHLYSSYGRSDHEDFCFWIDCFYKGQESLERPKLYRRLHRETRAALKSNWDSVTAVGDKLMERGQLSYCEVLELVQQNKQQTV